MNEMEGRTNMPITIQMISDWQSEEGYTELTESNCGSIMYRGELAFIMFEDDGTPRYFATSAWADDNNPKSKKHFCPNIIIPKNFPPDLDILAAPHTKMPLPDMELEEIELAEKLIQMG